MKSIFMLNNNLKEHKSAYVALKLLLVDKWEKLCYSKKINFASTFFYYTKICVLKTYTYQCKEYCFSKDFVLNSL